MSAIVVAHDPAWASRFEQEAKHIREALPDVDLVLHHIGSTAIPGILAKPIIDILLETRDLGALDGRSYAMRALGYEVMGEFGIPGRRYFRKAGADGVRSHHVHAFLRGSDGALRHLAFRDYMNAHPSAAEAYERIKRDLVDAHPGDVAAYVAGKADFVRAHEALALAWRRAVGRTDAAA